MSIENLVSKKTEYEGQLQEATRQLQIVEINRQRFIGAIAAIEELIEANTSSESVEEVKD